MYKLIGIKFGILRGIVKKNVLGGEYFAFKGIPYAEPPVGHLRFQDPIPWSKSWKGIRNAVEHGNICAQFDRITNSVSGSDDCLYLNVYTTSPETTLSRPVMMWIHGGAFLFGSGNDDLYGPDYLVKKDLVLVTINYRLDALGFLNLGLETAPGNQGLKDQVMALKWIKENISNFGGDPGNVTIFGESAGASSVHYLTQSPLSQGLFHKAICQSGVAINPWAYMHEDPTVYAFKLAALLGKESSDPLEVVEFLRTVDVQKIVEAQKRVITKLERFRMQFTAGPTVDIKSKTPFLPHPISIDSNLTEIKVPLLTGYNSREGLLFLAGMNESIFKEHDSKFAELLNPNFLKWLRKENLTPQDLKTLYFENRPICSESSLAYADMIGDMLFVSGIHDVLKIQSKKKQSPAYMYKFSHDPGTSFMRKVVNVDAPGACHFDEIPYLFHLGVLEKLDLASPTTNPVERKLMERITKMWTDFSKTGNPTPSSSELIPVTWEPVDNNIQFRYLNIEENLKLETMPSYDQLFANRRTLRNKL